jgi:hypothetical protein
MLVSKSGYLLTDLYIELERSMGTHDFQRACHLSCELVSSGQLKQLIAWLVKLVSKSYITTNACLLHGISARLNAISKSKFSWKSDVVQKSLCEVVVLLSKEVPVERCLYKKGSIFPGFSTQLQTVATKSFPELESNMGLVVGHEVFTLVRHLYNFMLEGNIKETNKVLYQICNRSNIPECETLDMVHNFVKTCKDDAVWILWNTLFIFVNRPPCNKYVQAYVHNSFKVFAFGYTKKEKQDRLNLLFACYTVCVKRLEVSYTNTCDDLVSKASSQIQYIYDDINSIKNDNKEHERDQQHTSYEHEEKLVSIVGKNKASAKKTDTKKKPKSNLTPEQQRDMDEKMKYFFVIMRQESEPSTNIFHAPAQYKLSETTRHSPAPTKSISISGTIDGVTTSEDKKVRIEKI